MTAIASAAIEDVFELSGAVLSGDRESDDGWTATLPIVSNSCY